MDGCGWLITKFQKAMKPMRIKRLYSIPIISLDLCSKFNKTIYSHFKRKIVIIFFIIHQFKNMLWELKRTVL